MQNPLDYYRSQLLSFEDSWSVNFATKGISSWSVSATKAEKFSSKWPKILIFFCSVPLANSSPDAFQFYRENLEGVTSLVFG